ncbi:hypothetical protein [Candidatus Nitrososphaera sp. FF02]|uniref:hypothetical protein n=1 Tax=Candidatus Nitrososphaera sp. FF02 TaxID=3398226 RepID=UPI0039EBF64D
MASQQLINGYKKRMQKANFVICSSCFWCATCFDAGKEFPACPACKGSPVDSLPISENEFYKVEIAGNRNIELSFGRSER